MPFAPAYPPVVHYTARTSTTTIITTPTPSHPSSATATETATRTMAALGSTSKPTNSSHSSPSGDTSCDTSCKVALGIIIPFVLLSLVAVVAYLAWGRGYIRQRKEKRAKVVEEGIAMRKLGDEGSVGEWEADDGEMRDVEIEGGRGEGMKKPQRLRWWSR